MSFIVLMRNPTSNVLMPLVTGDDEGVIAEFASASEAREQADGCLAASAWGYQVIDIDQGEV